MERVLRILTIVLVAGGFAGSFLGGGTAWADASSLKPFFGTYEGASLAPSAEAQPRDLNVFIKDAGEGGFTVAWQTTIYEDSDSKSRTQSLEFRPRKNNPNVYQAQPVGLSVGMVPSEDPLDGAPFAWARVLGKVLSVNVLNITKEGDYVMQTYDRALTPGGLALSFVKVRNGNVEKKVWGSLERIDN